MDYIETNKTLTIVVDDEEQTTLRQMSGQANFHSDNTMHDFLRWAFMDYQVQNEGRAVFISGG